MPQRRVSATSNSGLNAAALTQRAERQGTAGGSSVGRPSEARSAGTPSVSGTITSQASTAESQKGEQSLFADPVARVQRLQRLCAGRCAT